MWVWELNHLWWLPWDWDVWLRQDERRMGLVFLWDLHDRRYDVVFLSWVLFGHGDAFVVHTDFGLEKAPRSLVNTY